MPVLSSLPGLYHKLRDALGSAMQWRLDRPHLAGGYVIAEEFA